VAEAVLAAAALSSVARMAGEDIAAEDGGRS
jgi:hypothetical protein